MKLTTKKLVNASEILLTGGGHVIYHQEKQELIQNVTGQEKDNKWLCVKKEESLPIWGCQHCNLEGNKGTMYVKEREILFMPQYSLAFYAQSRTR